MTKKYIFFVSMTCSSCAESIKHLLQSNGYPQHKVDWFNGLVEVSLKDEKEISTVRNLFEECGYSTIESSQSIRDHLIKGFTGTLAGFALLILSMTGVILPMMVMYAMVSISILLTLYLGKETYKKAFADLKNWHFTMDTLFAVSALAAIALTVAAHIVPGLPMICEMGLLILGFNHFGKAMIEATRQSISIYMTNRDLMPEGVEQVKPGDQYTVQPGMLFPFDGWLSETDTNQYHVYTDNINGITVPTLLKSGSRIQAGMRLADDSKPLTYRVEKTFAESWLGQDDTQAETIKKKKRNAPYVEFANRVTQYSVPVVLGLAAASFIVLPLQPALTFAMFLLGVVCPCTAGLITPAYIHIGMNKAKKAGALFKDGNGLQTAAEINVLAGDLNGTFTTGEYTVSRWGVTDKTISDKDFKKYLSLLEENSQHPMGKAIVTFTGKLDAAKLNVINEDRGVKASIGDDEFHLGDLAYMKRNNIYGLDSEGYIKLLSDHQTEYLCFLAKNKRVVGYVELTSPLRSDAIATVQSAKAMGILVYLFSGSEQRIVLKKARELDIPPERVGFEMRNKEVNVKQLQDQGYKVAMMGDAGNDRLALAQSDLGVVVPSAAVSKVMLNNADVKLTTDALMPFIISLHVARQTVKNIKVSLGINIGYNIVAMSAPVVSLALAGMTLNPVIGPIAMNMQTAFVMLNLFRFKRQPLPVFETEFKNSYRTMMDKMPRNDALQAHDPREKPIQSATIEPMDINLVQGAPNEAIRLSFSGP